MPRQLSGRNGAGRGKLVVRAEAVDPGIDHLFGNNPPGRRVSTGFGDHLRFASKHPLPCLGIGGQRVAFQRAAQAVHGMKINLARRRRQRFIENALP